MATMKTDSLGRRRRRKPGDIGQLRRVLWGALLELEEKIHYADIDSKIKACNALANLARTYLAATEQADFESRITALEQQVNQYQPVATNGRVKERVNGAG